VETTPDGERHPRGSGGRHVVGELLTCPHCLGSWCALSLIGLRAAAPRQARVAATLLGLSYVNSLLQARVSEQEARANA